MVLQIKVSFGSRLARSMAASNKLSVRRIVGKMLVTADGRVPAYMCSPLTAKSAECKTLLERCSNEDVFGITLFEIVHEATHIFMLGEAKAKGLFNAVEKGAKYLSHHPNEVKNLSDYWVNTQRLLALNILVLPMEQNIVVAGQAERANAGLLTNDSITVAAMREYGISRIATNDGQFDAVAGISVYSPTDVA